MNDIRITVCGSRNFIDEKFVNKYLSEFIQFLKKQFENEINIIIISGKAKGPDTFGENFAKNNNLQIEEFPADWDKHGKRAGYIRNKEMIDISNIVIAFYDGTSKGTAHSIKLAKDKGILTLVAGTKEIKKIYNKEALEALVQKCKNQQE